MRTIFDIILTLISIHVYSQCDVNYIRGTVIDSISKEALPFATITHDTDTAHTNFEGIFTMPFNDKSSTQLMISYIGFQIKTVSVSQCDTNILVSLVPLPYPTKWILIIRARNPDTVFYNNGKIKNIYYLESREYLSFSRKGILKSFVTKEGYDTYYGNGRDKNQICYLNDSTIQVIKWHKNGQIKQFGTIKSQKINFHFNSSKYKNNDWKYWTRKGKRKKK